MSISNMVPDLTKLVCLSRFLKILQNQRTKLLPSRADLNDSNQLTQNESLHNDELSDVDPLTDERTIWRNRTTIHTVECCRRETSAEQKHARLVVGAVDFQKLPPPMPPESRAASASQSITSKFPFSHTKPFSR